MTAVCCLRYEKEWLNGDSMLPENCYQDGIVTYSLLSVDNMRNVKFYKCSVRLIGLALIVVMNTLLAWPKTHVGS